ncbi:hypothetical protein AMS68_002176 [Peltaster fructicola]|uniref:Ribosomal protein S13 n=1 Tax=Peltaster fructicola TaxID=286661 RepID=A0A6H0XPW0_9PEZI|nr:hypothetical protein AMS68_002176 [Peltaster fructicola]
MVLIFGRNFDATRLVARSLQTIYGVGPDVCQRVMSRLYIHKAAKVGALGDKQIKAIEAELGSMVLENALRREVRSNIARLRDIGSYRGRRHAMGLPVRGQNTRSQIKTATKLNKVERLG